MSKERIKLVPSRRRKSKFPYYILGKIRPTARVLAIFLLGGLVLSMGDSAGVNFNPKIIVDAYKAKNKVSKNIYGYSIDSEFEYDDRLLTAAKENGARTVKIIQGVDSPARFLAKVEHGDYKMLASDNVPYNPGQEYKVKVEARDSNIKIFIDDVLIFDVQDNSFFAGELSLISSYNQKVSFDDVKVYNAAGQIILEDDFNHWFNNGWHNADLPDWYDNGSWYLKDGKFYHKGKQGLAIKSAGSRNWHNYSVEAKMTTSSEWPYDQGFMGLALRQNGVYNSYKFLWRSEQRQPVFDARPWGVADFEGQLRFSQDGGFRPIVTVNMRGTAEEAADLVRRLNIYEGRNIKHWELGNETYMYGDGFMPIEVYAEKVKKFSRAMKAVDPSIKVGANIVLSFGNWEEELFKRAGEEINFVVFHFYPFWAESNISNTQLLASPHSFAYNYKTSLGKNMGVVKRTKKLLKRYVSKKKRKKMKFFVTEFNTGNYKKGISMVYGLTVADLLGKMAERQVKFGQFHKLGAEDNYQWGAFTSDYQPKPAALAMEMYAKHFGKRMLNTLVVQSPKFSNGAKKNVPKMKNIPYLTAYSSRAKKKKKVYLIVVNKHAVASLKSDVFINNALVKSKAKVYTMNSATMMSSNIADQQNVNITESEIDNASNHFKYKFPAHSVTAFEFDVKIKQTKKDWGGKYVKKNKKIKK